MKDTAPASLAWESLHELPAAVGRPDYTREQRSPGIVHFGPGNFHRAHMGVYLDALMNAGRDHDWAVIGASIMPGDAALRQSLIDQELLGTVVAQSADASEARVTGHLIDYLPVGDTDLILAALVDPQIRIVSLTVTEGGYFVNADTGAFDPASPAIVADAQNIETPATVFGLITRALMLRREAGSGAFTVMSCDNLPHNGQVARGAVLGLAQLVDAELAGWIEQHASFPNGMVDRIAPATGPRERRLVREEHGVDDTVPVFCEDYLQWVLEDDFVAGRPALETVGVDFAADVTPFETMKIRILNGGHALIAYPGALLGLEFADQAMEHPLVAGFLAKVERDEILPVVPPVPGYDLQAYLASISQRFANPKIGDTTRRLCLDGSNRQPKFIIPSVRDRLEAGQPIEGLALGSALWCRYCHGELEDGTLIEPNDPNWDRLNQVARQARNEPLAWLAMADIYGQVGSDERFAGAFSHWLGALWHEGTEPVLQRYVKG